MTTATLAARPLPQASSASPTSADAAHILEAAKQACGRIAPLWPLQHFVAVNPFLGLVDRHFTEAADVMSKAAGARMTMTRDFYATAIADGRITDADLATAIAHAGRADAASIDVPGLKHAATMPTGLPPSSSVADVVSRTTGADWSTLSTERISSWAAGYFDEGQAAWSAPWRELSPYRAWRKQAMIDRTPELLGLAGFRQAVRALPESAEAMLVEGSALLGLQGSCRVGYFHRLLMTIGGWASYARYRVWQSELQGNADPTLIELLAVRVAWDVAILQTFGADPTVQDAWKNAARSLGREPSSHPSLIIDELLQVAYELAWQRDFLGKLASPPPTSAEADKAVQAAFCIDVRSETFRRALERTSARVQTLGFAGFFGVPMEYVPLGQVRGSAQCPVLLAPKFTVRETVHDASPAQRRALKQRRQLRHRIAQAWRTFKLAAVSSFAFVETMGWTYLAKLATDGFGLTRVVPDPAVDGLSADELGRLRPDIAADELAGRATGIGPSERLDMAEALLKGMSLTSGFARLVLLAGHGSSTVNNPHASGLDCGACGGHNGGPNARVAAAILNDPVVRAGLFAREIQIPQGTVFLAGLHDTTTDAFTLFDLESLPPGHADDLAQLQSWLADAGHLARTERAGRLNINADGPLDAQVIARSRDWSQPRAEWGLAGCAAFIVAPRRETEHMDLGGRAFLHTYDWRQDRDGRVLESIMTAPMVVASWINLQYYGSTVDNRVFGCGNKVLHNVVGLLGVLEGHGGDLRSGLPWQSLHDGERLIHEPLRLTVVIAAPVEAINRVISQHEAVRQLVDNGWLHLFARPEADGAIQRYRGALKWEAAA